MVFGPDFGLVRTLPSVPELLIWVDNACCQQGTTASRSTFLKERLVSRAFGEAEDRFLLR
jgi:hypothetical protein